MAYELHRSGVVTGSLNCFCLACDALLQCAHDAAAHVRTAQHQHEAGAVHFSDKFPHEHIKKFKRGYYCEFCNVLLPIASKVNVHIAEDEHKHNKGVLLLKPLARDVVAFNNVLIEENAWHGLMQGVCSLCNAEYEDESDHKANAEHSLNLVLKPIQFGASNAIFRPLDDTAVQCLTCNKLVAPGKMSKHLVDAEHLEVYAKRRIGTNVACQRTKGKENCQEKANVLASVTEHDDEMKSSKIDNDVNTNNEREYKNDNEKPSTNDKSKILESIVKYQTKGVNINLETETAFCKKCSEVVTFDSNKIEDHIDNHSSAAEVNSDLLYPSHLDQHMNRVDINDRATQSKDDQHTKEMKDTSNIPQENVQNDGNEQDDDEKSNQEEREFAKANEITYNGHNKQSFCRICEVQLPVSFKSMKEHVDGNNHSRLAANSKPSSSTPTAQPKTPVHLSKQATEEFLDTAVTVETLFYNGSVINTKYCMLASSLFLISDSDSRMRCFVCDINLSAHSDINDHANSTRHRDKWRRVPVITSEKNEFIREVRPGEFHCAFCHLVVFGWTDMKSHLECSEHRIHKTLWEMRLREHLPDVQAHIVRERLMRSMLMGRMFNFFSS
ncbi:hypothetical protein PYW08_009776 [Mythimna loreyi]|uniref:Uncharacterized protein n=1 Tax=Mythimna loreyi TaxID=667449 RepID=A0ACC2Q7E6_9NEOP|nr:hypothetical protein PYW08_009776 [Mythimna loreyi]